MTDEEKAINYATTECCNSCSASCGYIKCNMFCNVRNAVLYGLAEGRKEKECHCMAYFSFEDLEKENDEQIKVILKLQGQIESLTETLKSIATDTNEHITHNVAQNELDKWEKAE